MPQASDEIEYEIVARPLALASAAVDPAAEGAEVSVHRSVCSPVIVHGAWLLKVARAHAMPRSPTATEMLGDADPPDEKVETTLKTSASAAPVKEIEPAVVNDAADKVTTTLLAPVAGAARTHNSSRIRLLGSTDPIFVIDTPA